MTNESGLARERVTLADIAVAAGVSVATVSKVRNGRADVAASTRSRVEAVLADHKYGRKPMGRARLIDLAFADLSPWSVEIIRGAEEAAAAEGCRIAVSVVSGEAATEAWLARLSVGQIDGVILVLTELAPVYREQLAAMFLAGGHRGSGRSARPSNPVDRRDQLGWRPDGHGAPDRAGPPPDRIITGRPALLCSQARLDGYRSALGRAGIPADPGLIYAGDFLFEGALVAARDMLGLADPPTAIFAGSDMQAMGVYEAARLRKLRIPDDLSVVGFDDLPMSAWVSPPLTTVVQPLASMAAMATRTVLDSLGGRTNPSSNRVELTTSLVVRASTAPPRRKAAVQRQR